MKLEAFSEVSNLVRHLEGLEARKAQLAELIATDAATNYIIDIQQKQTDAQGETYYACKAFMQSHDADAPFASVEILIAALLERLEQRITVVKIKLRDLGVNLDEGKRTHPEFVIYEGESYPWDKPTPGDRLPENAIVTERHETSGKALAWAFR